MVCCPGNSTSVLGVRSTNNSTLDHETPGQVDETKGVKGDVGVQGKVSFLRPNDPKELVKKGTVPSGFYVILAEMSKVKSFTFTVSVTRQK